MSPDASSRSLSRSAFAIPKMNCPSEERLVRMALQDLPGVSLSFDLAGRRLTAVHPGPAATVLDRLVPLGLYGSEPMSGLKVAGGLVAWAGSHVPDLVIGAVIAALVVHGARRILALR